MTDKTAGQIYRIEKLSYAIDGHRILDDVSFSIGAGEFVAIIGPNGAGKSTLLKHLVRVNRPPKNTVFLHGRCILEYKQKDIAARVGYVPQSSPVYLPFTALQFVLMGRYPHTNPLVRPDAEQTGVAYAMLEKVGMREFAHRRLDAISGGERQKIFIAAALAQEPEILLLDEPTTYLDPKHQCEIHDILGALNRDRNLAVLAVSHDINFASRFSNRVVAMKKGSVFFDGPVSGTLSGGLLEKLFDTGFDFIRQERTGDIFAVPESYREDSN
jgi:iron complex transport system ATP-binding protein